MHKGIIGVPSKIGDDNTAIFSILTNTPELCHKLLSDLPVANWHALAGNWCLSFQLTKKQEKGTVASLPGLMKLEKSATNLLKRSLHPKSAAKMCLKKRPF
jgi:hypothetical protein